MENVMPYKTDKTTIKDPFLDRRTKLLPCQKEMVHFWYGRGTSINKLSKLFHVNKRLIQFVLFPERQKKNLELRRDRGGTAIYYDKKKHNTAANEHRVYKYKTLKHTIK